ncbi:MAG: transposase family protein [Anaerolineae bacterium]|nr:transposase family protein [Anaerolineae bacterium]MDW8070053.1 transposase family protein [Anaerolineae bacterium]
MGSSQGRKSLLDHLRAVPDPRQRQGQRYPLAGLLAVLILAALHGQSSLRGMWLWARAHQQLLLQPLGFGARGRLPALTTLWNLLQRLDVGALLQAMNTWARDWGAVTVTSLDTRHLHTGKRGELPAVQALVLTAQQLAAVLQQRGVKGDALEAALALLEEIPLEARW